MSSEKLDAAELLCLQQLSFRRINPRTEKLVCFLKSILAGNICNFTKSHRQDSGEVLTELSHCSISENLGANAVSALECLPASVEVKPAG